MLVVYDISEGEVNKKKKTLRTKMHAGKSQAALLSSAKQNYQKLLLEINENTEKAIVFQAERGITPTEPEKRWGIEL